MIDPGDEPGLIQNAIEEDLEPIAIINTHAHLDHIGAVIELKKSLEYHSIYIKMKNLS